MINTLCKHGIEAESCSYCLEYAPQARQQASNQASKEDSLQALQQEAEAIVKYYMEDYNMDPITVKVKKVRRGWAIYNTRSIIMPIWPLKANKDFWTAYLLHEISHFINWDLNHLHGHGIEFKQIEREILKEKGWVPVYSRAYIKELKTDAGEVLYNRKAYRASQVQA